MSYGRAVLGRAGHMKKGRRGGLAGVVGWRTREPREQEEGTLHGVGRKDPETQQAGLPRPHEQA